MLVDEYRKAQVDARTVWLQSFNLDDIRSWLHYAPDFARQAVYLDGRYANASFNPALPDTITPSFADLYREGLRVIAPPMWVLLQSDASGAIVPSAYANATRRAGLQIITWTAERSGAPPAGFYFQSFQKAIARDGDLYFAIDVLARVVHVLGIFADWPATITYYANCGGIL